MSATDQPPVWGGPNPTPTFDPSPPKAPPPFGPDHPYGIIATSAWTIAVFVAITISTIPAVIAYKIIAPVIDKPVNFSALMEDGDFLWINYIFTLLATSVVLAAALLLRPRIPIRQYLALRPAAFSKYLIFAGALFLYGISTELLLRLLHIDSMPAWMQAVPANTRCPVLLFFAIVVAAPLLEEFVFRGFVFTGFRWRLGAVGAVLASTIPWALLHVQYEWVYILVTLGIGLILGYAREKSGSILVPLALHALSNIVAFAQMMWPS